MNKKFLSAILFGALMVTSTGTFVSCKDYDDDIDEINNKISGIEGQIKDLQTKIDAGKWITSVSSVTGGFTVAFSDGSSYTITNGKDGATGEAGAAGTKWTISTDGYWECDGVKTDVKAVGKDGATGEAGKDAQKEVEKRADGWYLWNGTEFEKVTVDAPATAGVPYYQIDPADENYAIMHIYDATGKNEQAIRLPLNEGLVQLMVRNFIGALDINFAKAKTDIKWEGKKTAPKKGEYIITQSFDSLLVQVTPTKFDLASIEDLALMTSQNVKVPVTLGAPVAFKGILSDATSRAVSEGGLYKISVTPDAITEANVKLYGQNNSKKPYVSLVATDKVRSSYGTAFSLNEVKTSQTISFGIIENNQFISGAKQRNIRREPGETVYIVAESNAYLYDAYLTVADDNKADSIKYELVTDKTLNIKSNDKADGQIKFIVHYMDTYGTVYPTAAQIKAKTEPCIYVNYEAQYEEETISSIEAASHTAVAYDVKNPDAQSMLVDLAGYFDGMSTSDRILWNADASISYNTTCTWTYTQDGQTKTKKFDDLIANVAFADAAGKATSDNSQAAQLLVNFTHNYGSGLSEFSNGQIVFNIYITDPNKKVKQTIEIPFEIKNPTTAEQQKHYSFNTHYYASGVFTVIDANSVEMSQMITVERGQYNYSIDFSNMKVVKADEDHIYRSGYSGISLGDGKKGTEYGVEGVVFNYLNRPIELDAFKVKFVDSKAYSIVSGKALSFQSGKVETKTVKYAKEDNKDAFYGVVTALGDLVTVADIANIVTVDFVSPKNGENKDLIQTISIDPATFVMTITSTNAKATVDDTVTVKVKATLKSGETAEGTVTFSIKKFPTAE